MTTMQGVLAGLGGATVVLAVFAGWREAARTRRRDPDAVGLVAWPTVQMLALIAAVVCGYLFLKDQ